MDKNTVIGFLLIGSLLFGFAWFNKPSEAEVALQAKNDSIAAVATSASSNITEQTPDPNALLETQLSDTAKAQMAESMFGAFANATQGTEKIYTLENKLIKLKINSKGGQIVSVQLKNYKDTNGKPLILFDSKTDSTSLSFNFITANNRLVNTKDMYFEAINLQSSNNVSSGEKSFTFRLKTSTNAYVDYIYTLKAEDYMLGFKVKANGMETVMPLGVNSLEMNWNTKIKQQEKSKKFENRYAALHYKYVGEDMEYLSEASDASEAVATKLQWIAFKDQFFSSILIADDAFTGTKLDSKVLLKDSTYLKKYSADMNVAFDPRGEKATSFRFFFGPNKFQILESYNKGVDEKSKLNLEKLVPLGWGVFGWINQWVVIPIFNFFSSFIASFGIIILLLTLVIKLVLFPMTYKSYVSMAKMRVLKPQIDEINTKHSKPAERQQATMALYKKVGVNPLGGCLPMLLQMPILFAMFSFFPAAIELRQESFLWASDLSSYDAIVSWSGNIPLVTEYFGNHLSLFCLLMTITNLVYTHINMGQQMESSQQIPGMKYMMYAMPVIFMFMFNDYASGLSYYYFIATLITILQTIAIRYFVDEEKLLAKLHANAKNPKKQKKSGFMARLEEAQRRQIELQKQKNKR